MHEVRLATAEDTRAWGEALGRQLRAGDVLVLSGDLGAGKTTLTQGLAEGLRVRGPITSPTFVISRVHPSLGDGPALVHVDAYRLGDAAELDDLDLDTSVEDAVTVIEWGTGIADGLSDDRLEITILRPLGEGDAAVAEDVDAVADPDETLGDPADPAEADPAADVRVLTWTAVGESWSGRTLDLP